MLLRYKGGLNIRAIPHSKKTTSLLEDSKKAPPGVWTFPHVAVI